LFSSLAEAAGTAEDAGFRRQAGCPSRIMRRGSNHGRRGRDLVTGSCITGIRVKRSKKLELENTLMKPFTIAIIGALVVAVAVLGYLYYQRTRNDITIQMPKVELKN
jgi:hypothetical protein